VDDGAKTFEESLAMVTMAAEAGTTDIVATPHADLQYTFQPYVITERIAALQEKAGEAIRIHRGCDFHLVYDNIQDAIANPRKYTINHKRYLLVEFSEMTIFPTTTEMFERLLGAGMVPVITHPERNSLLRQRVSELSRWVEMGCLLQITGSSFLGNFGPRAKAFSDAMMERGMVHVVASDGHDLEHRPPVLDEVREYLEKQYGAGRAERLTTTNPRAILHGAERLPPWPETGGQDDGQGKKWFQFWR
jgi:protein-tyrosine phosphatase